MEKYNLKKEDCIFVTDTLGDINEAKKVGIETIGIFKCGIHSKKILEKGNPNFLIEDFDELFNLFDEELIPECDVFDTWFTSASSPDLATNSFEEKNSKIKAIVFDVDGVIFDSKKHRKKIHEKILKKINLTLKDTEQFLEKPKNFLTRYKEIKKKFNLDFDVSKLYEEFCLEDEKNYKKYEFFSQTKKFIEENYKNYLFFTNTLLNKSRLEKIFKTHNLHGYFFELYHFESGEKNENILKILKKHNLKKEEIIFIDDNKKNIEIVENLGVKSIHFNLKTNIEKEISKFNNSSTLKEKLFPMTLRPQGHDIINNWLFYTMTKNIFLYNKNPFLDVNISGFILASDGTKMSKSKGNTIVPQKIVEKFSNDSLRYGASSTKLGCDLPFQEKEIQTGIRVVNKIYNASKFTENLLGDFSKENKKINLKELNLIDEWIINKCQKVCEDSRKSFDIYDYEKAKSLWVNFFMRDVCDNYLEIVKVRLWEKKENYISAQKTLYYVLFSSIKALSPIIPFICEEVYQIFYRKFEEETSIHKCKYSKKIYNFNKNLDELGNKFCEVVEVVRKFKSQNKLSLKEKVSKIKILCEKEIKIFLEKNIEDLKDVCHFIEIEFLESKSFEVEIKL